MNIITIIKTINSLPSLITEVKDELDDAKAVTSAAVAVAKGVKEEVRSLAAECETIKDGCEGFKDDCESCRDEVTEKLEELEDYRSDCEGFKDDCESAKDECESAVSDLGDRLDELESKVADILAKLDGLLKSAPADTKEEERKTYALKELVRSDIVNEESGIDSWVEAISWVDNRHHEEALRMHGLVPSEMTEEELEEFSCPAELESELTMISNREGYRFYADGTPVTTEGKED